MTRTRIAGALGVGREGVSRIEHRGVLLISAVRSYVEAMDRSPVLLAGLAGAAFAARLTKGGTIDRALIVKPLRNVTQFFC